MGLEGYPTPITKEGLEENQENGSDLVDNGEIDEYDEYDGGDEIDEDLNGIFEEDDTVFAGPEQVEAISNLKNKYNLPPSLSYNDPDFVKTLSSLEEHSKYSPEWFSHKLEYFKAIMEDHPLSSAEEEIEAWKRLLNEKFGSPEESYN